MKKVEGTSLFAHSANFADLIVKSAYLKIKTIPAEWLVFVLGGGMSYRE